MAGEEGIEQLVAVAAGTHWTGMRRLELSDLDNAEAVASDDRPFTELIRRPQFRKLRRLNAMGNALGNNAARAIANAGLTELRYLDLSINDIEEPGAKAIAASRLLPNLRFLDLGTCKLGVGAAAALIVTRKLPNLTVLNVDHMQTDSTRDSAARLLASASHGSTLRGLFLERAPLTVPVLAALGKCPAIQELWFLSLRGCNVGDRGLAAFTKNAQLGQLAAIDLEDNALTARGMQTLAAWPGAASLQSLDLTENTPGADGAKALIQSEYMKKLKLLKVDGGGTKQLQKHFGKKVVP
jgi:hypothetical protein